VSTPLLRDGSWRRLTDIANHYDLGFEVVLWARTFDLAEWGEALRKERFDVLDARVRYQELLSYQNRLVGSLSEGRWAPEAA